MQKIRFYEREDLVDRHTPFSGSKSLESSARESTLGTWTRSYDNGCGYLSARVLSRQ